MELNVNPQNVDIALQAIVTLCKKQTELIDLQLSMAKDILKPQENVVVPKYNESSNVVPEYRDPIPEPPQHQVNSPQFDYSQVRPREYPSSKPSQVPPNYQPEPTYDPRMYNRNYNPSTPPPYQVVSEDELLGYGDPGMEYRT